VQDNILLICLSCVLTYTGALLLLKSAIYIFLDIRGQILEDVFLKFSALMEITSFENEFAKRRWFQPHMHLPFPATLLLLMIQALAHSF
jgi:hypothetical protein